MTKQEQYRQRIFNAISQEALDEVFREVQQDSDIIVHYKTELFGMIDVMKRVIPMLEMMEQAIINMNSTAAIKFRKAIDLLKKGGVV